MRSNAVGGGVTYFKLGVGWCSYDASTLYKFEIPYKNGETLEDFSKKNLQRKSANSENFMKMDENKLV
jgi:hypothetical protein